MKGFPNQVSQLNTLTEALRVLMDVKQKGINPKDDGFYGEALIVRGVLGTGHKPIPVKRYLAQQKAKKRKSDQSYRTRARGLRELFRVLGLIVVGETEITVTPAGKRIASFAGTELSSEAMTVWRARIVNMTHDGGDNEVSHPYQVLLRLVARYPGITRAKCALALEAKNDSDCELSRIIKLAALEEDKIREAIGVTKSTWDNAKKILPRFAEQLNDVQKVGDEFYLGDAPGILKDSPAEEEKGTSTKMARRPKSASSVTADSIAKAGTVETWDESRELEEKGVPPEAVKARKDKLRLRLKRHNQIVQKMALQLESEDADLYENPFDCLACFSDEGLLFEVKSLDGSERDEVSRVRDALSQLLYYESFVTRALVKKRALRKIACFEHKISGAHIEWLQSVNIYVIWNRKSGFEGTEEAKLELEGHFGF